MNGDRTIRALFWATYLLLAWWTGGLTAWIAPWQRTIVLVAGGVFLLVVLVALVRRPPVPATNEQKDPGAALDAMLVSLVHLLPVFLLMGLGVTHLGGQAYAKAAAGGGTSGAAIVDPAGPDQPGAGLDLPRGSLDPQDDLSLGAIASPGHTPGPVQTIGMVFPPDPAQAATLPGAEAIGPEPLVLYRFEITCCAADAMPRTVLLRGLTRDRFPEDTWVRLRGRLTPAVADGPLAMIDVDLVEPITEPAHPYLERSFQRP